MVFRKTQKTKTPRHAVLGNAEAWSLVFISMAVDESSPTSFWHHHSGSVRTRSNYADSPASDGNGLHVSPTPTNVVSPAITHASYDGRC